MTEQQTRLEQYIGVIQRANEIAASTELDALLDQMLDLIIAVTQSQAGTLYLYDAANHELIFKVVKGDVASKRLLGLHIPADRGVAGYALQLGEPIFIPDVTSDPHWERSIGELGGIVLHTMYCMPLLLRNQPVGVVQVFNLPAITVDDTDELTILHMLCDRLVTEVEKARLLEAAHQRERRQQVLVDIITQITRTLDRDLLLNRIMTHARDLLEVEATSIWVLDERTGELVLHIATGTKRDRLREIRIPANQGIIGEVVRTGKPMLASDVRQNPHFYGKIDAQSGFATRSILCVPLQSPRILLSGERGEMQAMTIGGAQALNKRNGRPFSDEDISLFETLASQAATVLRLSQLYDETSELYLGLIDVITSALDQRDPDTAGHSQRVSDFAVAIAQELREQWDLSQETIYRIRVGGMLHDIGKIGIPDAILTKLGALTEEERAVMQSHPAKGIEIFRKKSNDDHENETLLWRLRTELQAIVEHHERLDGSGYPTGLKDEQISQIGRIMAVADVFDAMTSDRRYRPGMPVEQVLQIMCSAAGSEFDPDCVAALVQAREHGKIKTQQERREKD